LTLSKGEKITDMSFMLALLKRVQQQKTLVTITIPRKPGTYNSAILEIKTNPYVIIFDELNPSDGHEHLAKARILEMKAVINGVEIQMQCHLIHIDTADKISKYHVAFPPHLWYQQQRQNFRVHVSSDMHFGLRIKYRDQDWHDASVVDLSPDGCGIEIEKNLAFDKGELIKHCELTLPDGTYLYCKMIVRYSSNNDQQNRTHVGVKIIDFEGTDRKLYLRTIQNAQREMIRRQSRIGVSDESYHVKKSI